MVHAVTLVAAMAVAAPLAGAIPLATLAAVLILVAWNMSEIDQFRALLRAPKSDIAVLLSTFGLTVFADLTVAVGTGLVLASLLFMKQMADVSNVSSIARELNDADDADELGALKDPNAIQRRDVPPSVEVYEINGPFFFGVADRLKDVLVQLQKPPKVFILRLRKVPAIDASGLHALAQFQAKCRRQGTTLVLSGVHAQPLFVFVRTGFDEVVGSENMLANIDDALDRARVIVGVPAVSKPDDAEPEVMRERAAKQAASRKIA
jgi:SulP family sulfate permease